jgi:hypothetical protein
MALQMVSALNSIRALWISIRAGLNLSLPGSGEQTVSLTKIEPKLIQRFN